MNPSIVKKVLAGVTVVSALASVVAGREAPTIVEPAKPKLDTRLQVKDELDLGRLEAARVGDDSKVDPFAPRSFGSTAAPQAKAPAVQAEAPALPFRYLGKMIDNGQLAVFLQKGNDSYTASSDPTLVPPNFMIRFTSSPSPCERSRRSDARSLWRAPRLLPKPLR